MRCKEGEDISMMFSGSRCVVSMCVTTKRHKEEEDDKQISYLIQDD